MGKKSKVAIVTGKEQASVAVADLRALLHGVLNGDPKVEREARELLYGKPA